MSGKVDTIAYPRMKLPEVKKRTAEPQNVEYRMSKGGCASLGRFLKKDRMHSFDIRHSLFDIRFFKVSFSIKLAAFFGQRQRSYETTSFITKM